MKTEGDVTSCEVQRQMCVDFVRTAVRPAVRPAYRLPDERFDDDGESLLGLSKAGISGFTTADLAKKQTLLIDAILKNAPNGVVPKDFRTWR